MSGQLTNHQVYMLDRLKKDFGVGDGVSVFLLKSGALKGFDLIAEVSDGWTLEDAPPGQPQTIVIAEREVVCTYDMLVTAKHFSINGEVYSVTGTFSMTGVTKGSSLREWLFPVSPSGETWP